MATSLVFPSPGQIAVRLASGAFAGISLGFPVIAAGPGGVDPFELPPYGITFPVVDGVGHVHVAFGAQNPPAYTVVHLEHDGAGWTREDVAADQGDPPWGLDVGSDGTVHLAWGTGTVHLARRSPAGQWAVELLTGLPTDYLSLAGDAAGGTHFMGPPHQWRILDPRLPGRHRLDPGGDAHHRPRISDPASRGRPAGVRGV